jgi:1-acyl-sn-glycerol-3-phosphate acyltransferase
MLIRGYAALSSVAVFMLVCDLVQRAVVCPAARMWSASGPVIIGRWQRFIAGTVFVILERIGGANMPRPGRVPGGPGVLILMNHQSLLDIPLVIASVDGAFSRIVTRRRYASGIPLISHMLRTLKYPVVDPGTGADTTRRHLDRLDEVARTSDGPLVLFPEGTRTRDGEIGPFRTTGLDRILGARDWLVYVFVGDGYWRHARFGDLLRGMQDIEGHLRVLGPFEWEDAGADPGNFIARMRMLMVDELARMRGAEAEPETPTSRPGAGVS